MDQTDVNGYEIPICQTSRLQAPSNDDVEYQDISLHTTVHPSQMTSPENKNKGAN